MEQKHGRRMIFSLPIYWFYPIQREYIELPLKKINPCKIQGTPTPGIYPMGSVCRKICFPSLSSRSQVALRRT
jgi:hypothetical protein